MDRIFIPLLTARRERVCCTINNLQAQARMIMTGQPFVNACSTLVCLQETTPSDETMLILWQTLVVCGVVALLKSGASHPMPSVAAGVS